MRFETGVVIAPTGAGEQVVLWLYVDVDRAYPLSQCDTKEEGIAVAQHFAACGEAAYDDGYETLPGYFVKGNHRIPFDRALDMNVSVSRFRRWLKAR